MIKHLLIKLHFIATQFGIDPLRLARSLRGLPHYFGDWLAFRPGHQGALAWMPCLHDRFEEGGATKSEYFWQDLMVARAIHTAKPVKHVDIGSRVDGFVAHVASFREIEVFDVRPISTAVPGVLFRQADLMDPPSLPADTEGGGYCDSLSCLHAIEHFGLGRYGDTVDSQGFRKGIENMAKLLRCGGTFYLSTPIGKERVEFNANWVFDPRTIVNAARNVGMELKKLTIFNPRNGLQESSFDESTLLSLSQEHYNLGMFTFSKEKN